MSIPTARVSITILKITGLTAATLMGDDTRYARCFAQAGSGAELATGRSRPIPNAGGDFDVSAENWTHQFDVDAGTAIAIRVAIGEDHGDGAPPAPVEVKGTIPSPWAPGNLTLGGSPGVALKVERILVKPADAAFIARAGAPRRVSGTLAVPRGYIVEILDIPGLYKPNPAAGPGTPGAEHVVGYRSEDNLGRVFTNRDAGGAWTSDSQFIDVIAQVTAFGGQILPVDTKINWTILDADDPTNDAPEFHRDWGQYVDPNDYDAAGKPTGAKPADNTAAFGPSLPGALNGDEDKLFGAAVRSPATARWAQAPGGPAPAATSRTEAKTDVAPRSNTLGKSSVRIHCPNVLGTNFILRADLLGTVPGVPVFGAVTGVITMWSRIDVEVVKMRGAHSLSGALPAIPKFLHPACVQLDFQAEREVSDPPGARTPVLDKPEIAASDEDSVFDPASIQWVNNPQVFTNKASKGWFFLGAARLPYPLPSTPPPGPGPGPPPTLYSGADYIVRTTGSLVWVELPAAARNGRYLEFTWTNGGVTNNVGFGVNRRAGPRIASGTPRGRVRLVIFGNDVTPEFTGHDTDGSINKATASMILYFPMHQMPVSSPTLSPGGFGVPIPGATVSVYPPGHTFTTGVSPTVTAAGHPDDEFFAGRTILFTRTGKFSEAPPGRARRPDFNARVIQTVVHEFLHAFGMPHKCGNWNWRTPRPSGNGKKTSCCMNYFDTWLIDKSKKVIPGTAGNQGNDMCGRHLMEVRRVHLDKNPGLKW